MRRSDILMLFFFSLCLHSAGSLRAQVPAELPTSIATIPKQAATPSVPGPDIALANLPLSFEANRGQVPREVRFLSRSAGYTVFLTDSGAVMVLERGTDSMGPSRLLSAQRTSSPKPPEPAVLRMKIEGASENQALTALEELPGHSNYFLGKDREKWLSNVPRYRKVRFQSVYPGIDLEYYGSPETLEYDFVVAPQADPGRIGLAIQGSDDLRIDQTGDIVVSVRGAEVRLTRPQIYQVSEKGKERIEGEYRFTGPNQIGFRIGAYDSTRTLVIDPQLSFSTFLGGSDYDAGSDVAVDSQSNVYIAGSTTSFDFPTTPGAYLRTARSSFVTKISADGSTAVYSTYYGVSSTDAVAKAIAVNAAGEAYLIGSVRSPDLPTTPNAFQDHCGLDINSSCTGDTFVAKLSADGSTLLYSSYLGGGAEEQGYGVAVGGNGNAYFYGATWSSDFPTTPGAYQTQKRGFSDVFVAQFNASASTGAQSLIYSTCVGGSGNNADQNDYLPHRIDVDAAGNAYFAGGTISTDFPTTGDAFQTAAPGNGDGFVVKLNPQGSGLVYSTYLGGPDSQDHANSIAIDAAGNAYVAGVTWSSTFPVTPGSLQDSWAGTGGFIAKLNPSGSALVYSTFFPNVNQSTGITSIALDASNNAFLTGVTSYGGGADFFPVASPIQDKCGKVLPPANFCSNDAFVAKLNAAGNALVFSTFLGGNNDETATGIAVDSAGDAYVVGQTYSFDFPSANAYQPACALSHNQGCADVYVSKLSGLKLPVFGDLPQYVTFSSPVGNPSTQSLTISNLGDAALSFSDISVGANGFSLVENSCSSSPGIVNPNESCTLTIGFTPPDIILHSGTLTISDNAYMSPHQVSLQGIGSDYSMAAEPGQATIDAGQSASFGVGAQPFNGFNQPVSLACSGAPPESSCQLGSNSLLMDGANIVTTTVTITTTTRSRSSAQQSGLSMRGFTASTAMLLFAGMLFTGKTRRVRGIIALIALALAFGGLYGCGNGSTPPESHGTPKGVYTITINASSVGLVRTTSLQLRVN